MRLTRHTDYAFRVLMDLGLHPGERTTIADIAERHRVSRQHLMKVVQGLVRNGFVHSVRGKNGGITLARAATTISVGDVCRRSEQEFAIAECFVSGSSDCPVLPACRLAGVLREALSAFFAVLDRYTIADLLVEPDALRQLLDGRVGPAVPLPRG